jgi:GNAT superfamily N-acetyltransferase
MTDRQIERLEQGQVREAFPCGKPQLDLFIHRLVSQYEKRNLGRTYVAVRPDCKQVLGYYTIASSAVPFQNLPEPSARKLPRHPVPVLLLARLAVDQSVQGKGWGAGLLIDALHRGVSLADKLGIYEVEVDAIDHQAKAFYEKYGFVALLDNEFHLYLPIVSIQSAIQRR